MKLKDVYNLIEGVALVKKFGEDSIKYGNAMLPEPTEKMMNMKVKSIVPFYNAKGLYRFGVIIYL